MKIELFQPHTTFSFQGVGKPAPSPFFRERELLGGFPESTSRRSAGQRGRFFAKSILCRHSAPSRIPHFEQFTFSPFRYTMMPGSKSLSPHELANRWVKDLLTRPRSEHKSGMIIPRYATIGQDCGSAQHGTIRRHQGRGLLPPTSYI